MHPHPQIARTHVTLLVLALACAACSGGDAPASDADTDIGADTDAASDAASDVAEDTTDSDEDAADADAELDADTDAPDTADDTDADDADDAGDADTEDVFPLECEPGPAITPDPVDTEQSKFALTMFHFNVEYVIGGLEYYDEVRGRMVQFLGLPINEGWDNDRVEDYIIRETLLPMLQMYDAHPQWRATFEMQAYAIELMAERHRDVLHLLRELAQRGQIELVSFHYAAQLFLAFPAEDQVRSLERTRAIFEQHCLPLSGVVFNQEGQAGEGRQRLLVEQGWRIGVFPRNLWRYVRGEGAWWPYYASEGGVLVVGPGGVDPASGIEVTWPFFDDGELRAVTETINPYAAAIGPHNPARVAEFAAELQALEEAGFKHTTITDYVHQLEGRGLEMPEAPPLLDGTWQPPSTDSIHRWLGGRSQANVGDEEDNRVRSGNAVARMHADATQVLVDTAAGLVRDVSEWQAEMDGIWEDLWHAEVSDASGVNPWRAEVLWCLALNDSVLARTEALRSEILSALGWEHVEVRLGPGYAVELDEVPVPGPPLPADPWFEPEISAAARTWDVSWIAVGENRVRLSIRFGASEGCDRCDDRRLSVGFPRTEDVIAYSPGLIEDEVRTYPLSDFSFLMDEVYLPLANGLIGLGDDLWIIKHTRHVHIAARVAPDDDHIRFVDAALWRETAPTWVFEVVRGSAEQALAVATEINIDPVVVY